MSRDSDANCKCMVCKSFVKFPTTNIMDAYCPSCGWQLSAVKATEAQRIEFDRTILGINDEDR